MNNKKIKIYIRLFSIIVVCAMILSVFTSKKIYGEEASSRMNNHRMINYTFQKEVTTFAEMQQAMIDAPQNENSLIILKNIIEVTSRINIPAGKNITLATSEVITPVGTQEQSNIQLPKQDDSVERRMQLVEDAKKKGEIALAISTTLNSVSGLKRSATFSGELINVDQNATLTLGQSIEDGLVIDGNTEIKTANKGMIVVKGTLQLNGGTITNSNNEKGYSAPIFLEKNANMVMNGGRITKNKNISYVKSKDGSWLGDYYSTGGIYVSDAASLTINGGSIDNNTATVGGIFVGAAAANTREEVSTTKAQLIINGGYIVNNRLVDVSEQSFSENIGGGIHVDANATVQLNNGIIAGNESSRGGAIAVHDNYVTAFDGVSYSNTVTIQYDEYKTFAGAELIMNGGLLYKNKAKVYVDGNNSAAGGAIYANSSLISLNKGYIIGNSAENQGGGLYMSIVPHTLNLKNTLISKNRAVNGQRYQYSAGEGGGYWNCPVGVVDFQDFHSVYIFDNTAESEQGGDIRTVRKASRYFLNRKNVSMNFYTHISPITQQGGIIRYTLDNGEVAPNLNDTNNSVALKAQLDEQTKQEAWKNSNMFILENEALKGGGIGSNANIKALGEPQNYELIVEKKWDSTVQNFPDSIDVDLYISNNKYSEMTLSTQNNYRGTFKNLPYSKQQLIEKGLQYRIVERNTSKTYPEVIELGKALKLTRVWLNPDHQYSTVDSFGEALELNLNIDFINKNNDIIESRNTILKYDRVNPFSTEIVHEWFEGNEKQLNITYHSTDQKYANYIGLYNYTDEPHRIIIHEPENDVIKIELPYLWTNALDTTGYPNNIGFSDDYTRNNIGYKINGIVNLENSAIQLINHQFNELYVRKNWEHIPEELRVSEIKVGLFMVEDGEEKPVLKNNEKREVTLNATNNWTALFDELPSEKAIPNNHYIIKELTPGYYLTQQASNTLRLNLQLKRKGTSQFTLGKDYPGGIINVSKIPITLKYQQQNIPINIKYQKNSNQIIGDLISDQVQLVIPDVTSDAEIVVQYYLDENDVPFPRNLGTFKNTHNEGEYIVELVKEANNKFILRIPKLTPNDSSDELIVADLDVKNVFTLVGNNYYLPEEHIRIHKKWLADEKPNALEVSLMLDDEKNTLVLNDANAFTTSIIKKGMISSIDISEEKLPNFALTQKNIESKLVVLNTNNESLPIWQGDTQLSDDQLIDIAQQIKNKGYVLNPTATDKVTLEVQDKVKINYPSTAKVIIDTVITMTNTQTNTIKIQKIWDDNNDENGIRPDEIMIKLFADGKLHSEHILSKAMNFEKNIDNLPIYDGQNKIQYTIKEEPVLGYESIVEGFTVRNKIIKKPKEDIKTNDTKNYYYMLFVASLCSLLVIKNIEKTR